MRAITSINLTEPPRRRSFLARLAESRVFFFVAVIVFRMGLDLGYWSFVRRLYTYAGFTWAPDLLKYLESWVLLIALILPLPWKLRLPSDFFIVILFCGLIVPLLSFYPLADQPRDFLYTVLLGYLLVAFARYGRPLRLPFVKGGSTLAWLVVVLGCATVTIWFIVSGATKFLNFDLTEVYEYRQAVGTLVDVGAMAYVNTWAVKVFGPVLLTIGLWQRQWYLVACALSLHVFWFGITAQKSVLFYPLLVLGVWVWFRRIRSVSVVPVGMAGVVWLVLAIYWSFGYTVPASLFVRRLFFVVAHNTFDYFQFFSEHQFVYWSNSITTLIIKYPYDVSPANLVGIWRDTGSHVNNTFLANGYMHAGILGIIIYGLAVGLLFRLVDSMAAQGIPPWVAIGTLIIPSWSLLLTADLPTALFTHGIGVAMVILFLLRTNHNRPAPDSARWPARMQRDAR